MPISELAELSNLILIVISLFTSLITASLGIGGGTLLLAIMAQMLPGAAIIPVHGAVQLGSNFGRTLLMVEYIYWPAFWMFAIGALVGVLIGGQIWSQLPTDFLKPILAVSILYSVWGPSFRSSSVGKSGMMIGGAVTTTLTMFIGATGPLVLALVKTFKLSPQSTVATSAICIFLQHLLKVLLFGVLGFSLASYLPLIVAMVTSGFIGTWIGKQILLNANPRYFNQVLNILLTVLAIRLLWS